LSLTPNNAEIRFLEVYNVDRTYTKWNTYCLKTEGIYESYANFTFTNAKRGLYSALVEVAAWCFGHVSVSIRFIVI